MIAIVTVEGKQTHLPSIIYFPDSYEIDKMIKSEHSNNETTTWVVHASSWWSIPRYEEDRQKLGEQLEVVVQQLLGEIEKKEIKIATPTVGHRWGMARCIQSIEEKCLSDDNNNLVACGDGFGGVDI